MSKEDRERLMREGAFAPFRAPLDYPLYHVPSDDLVGAPRTEAEIARAVRDGQRAALVGRSGTGKSSVLATILGIGSEHLPESVMPIRISLGANQEEVVTQPHRFAQYLITVVVEGVGQLESIERGVLEHGASERERRPARERAWRVSGRILWFGEVSRDVREVGQALDRERTGTEFIAQARRLLAAVRAHEVEPLLVFDDTDAWFGQDAHLADRFFGETLRVVVRELDCGLVAAVHPVCRSLPGYERARREILPVELEVPRLPADRQPLERIIERALSVHEVSGPVERLFPHSTVEGLAWHYASHARLRDINRVADRAIRGSTEAGAGHVTPQAVRHAIAELSPRSGSVTGLPRRQRSAPTPQRTSPARTGSTQPRYRGRPARRAEGEGSSHR